MFKLRTYIRKKIDPCTRAIIEEYHVVAWDDLNPQGEDQIISAECYQELRQGNDTINKRDKSYRKHNSNFSELSGCYENFGEFIDQSASVEKAFENKEQIRRVFEVVAQMSQEDQALFDAVLVQGISCAEYAECCNVSQQAISKRKLKIRKKLQIALSEYGLF